MVRKGRIIGERGRVFGTMGRVIGEWGGYLVWHNRKGNWWVGRVFGVMPD